MRLHAITAMLLALGLMAGVGHAQEAAQSTPQAPAASSNTPQASDTAVDAKPTEPLADAKSKKKKKKEKKPKMLPMHVVNGILTMDGATGKARMNYDIADFKFLYIWAPGVGVAVVSNVAFPLATEQPNAFNEGLLDVTAGGHKLEVFSDKPFLGKKPLSAWMYLDTDFVLPTSYPAMGFGATAAAPYAWPGSQSPPKRKKGVAPPPLPIELLPMAIHPPAPPVPAKTEPPPEAQPDAAKPETPTTLPDAPKGDAPVAQP